MMSRTKSGLLILASISVSEALSASITPANKPAKPDKPRNKDNSKPNFVYILSDDQDAATAIPEIMPQLYKNIAKHGMNYTNFFTPVSQCCPSRVGFLRGQHGHSHNVTSVTSPFGGYQLFCSFGYNQDNIFTWLQDAGYSTYYTGKLMNGNTVANAEALPVKGLDHSAILLDPWTYNFINATYTIDGGPPKQYPNVFSTDWIRDNSLSYLDKASDSDKPFFVGIAPIGPHSHAPSGPDWLPPLWAKRHDGLFADAVAPRKSSFNPDAASGASWISKLDKLNATEVDYIDTFYRARLRALQANDDLVGAVVKKLDDLGILDNTFIIHTADNGFTLGEHRRHPGKTTGYEEDIRVPFIVRGPGISAGKDTQSAHNNLDITATLVHLAGAEPEHELDGRVMHWGNINAVAKRTELGTVDHHLSEFWVAGGGEGKFASTPKFTIPTPFVSNGNYPNNTYRVLRVIEQDHDWAYTVWCTGERELYNMKTDQHQMNNLLASVNAQGPNSPLDSSTTAGRVATRLDALTLYLKYCKGIRCRYSWTNIFPYKEATSMAEAMDPKFDSYFDALPRVRYNNCQFGFHLENEFPYWTTNLAYYKSPLRPDQILPGSRMMKREWDWTGMGEWAGNEL